MQTFLPYPDFDRSAQSLDRQRLGKQRVETLQIVNTLDSGSSWQNHPAVKMWIGHREALIHYGFAICHEWQRRGYKDTIYGQLWDLSNDILANVVTMPPWLGDERLHSSHRSNLLRKDEFFYRKFGWTEPATLPYFWPSDWY